MTFCVHLTCILSQQETGFIYNGFGQTDHGVAKGRLQLTDGCGQQMVHAFYKNPFEFNSHRSLSFSTKLVCALVSKSVSNCDHGRVIVLQVIVVHTMITFLALGAVFVYARRKYAKEREEWEKEYVRPHRFTYRSLYEATKGFNKDRNEKRKKKKKKNQLSRTMRNNKKFPI